MKTLPLIDPVKDENIGAIKAGDDLRFLEKSRNGIVIMGELRRKKFSTTMRLRFNSLAL
ncbi:MAG: hypothetical protein ACOY90_15645 [Candidatus Zhuqueibacterota bacterium]